MDPHIYTKMRDTEENHWWFVDHKQMQRSVLKQLKPVSRTLDVGCGTGGNLAMYQEFSEVEASERNEQARLLASQRKLCKYMRVTSRMVYPFPQSAQTSSNCCCSCKILARQLWAMALLDCSANTLRQ